MTWELAHVGVGGARRVEPGPRGAGEERQLPCGKLSLGKSGLVMHNLVRYAETENGCGRRDLRLPAETCQRGGGRVRLVARLVRGDVECLAAAVA